MFAYYNMKPEIHYFKYFSNIHIFSFIFSFIFSTILLTFPLLCGKLCGNVENYGNKQKFINFYGTFLGIIAIGFKILDSIYRILYQYEVIPNVMLVHLCNFAVVFAGLYLITKSKILFNITYFLSFGAAFALILPGVTYYYNPTYVYIFMITHALEFVAVIYGFYYLKDTITLDGFKKSCFILIGMFVYAAIYNYIFKSYNINAMFLNEYIAPFVSFIKPFWLYRVVLVSGMLGFMYLMFLPFKNKNKI